MARKKNTVTAPARPAKSAVNGKPAPKLVLTHDQIAQQAYLIWLKKGKPTGLDEQNWREAEATLLNISA